MHGFALNVASDTAAFGRINPCGMAHCPITSLSRERGEELALAGVKELVSDRFPSLLERQLPRC